MFLEMWEKQKVLMNKFDQIETQNGLMQIPLGQAINLNCRFSQARLKDFSSRIAIEMSEATEALRFATDDLTHYEEEMADVYHFILETLILADCPLEQIFFHGIQALDHLYEAAEDSTGYRVDPENFPDDEMVRAYAYNTLEFLFLAMNELKMKPWKITGKATDTAKFYTLLSYAHFEFLKMCVVSGISAGDLYNSYMEKSEVNVQRIKNAH